MKAKSSVQIKNKKARFNYELLENYVAGIQLKGTEIKALRNNLASIAEAYCTFLPKALVVRNMYIGEYSHASFATHESKRDRILLLTKRELKNLRKNIETKGLTIIPLTLFINDRGLAKLSISLAKGKNTIDKRQTIKERDLARENQKILKNSH